MENGIGLSIHRIVPEMQASTAIIKEEGMPGISSENRELIFELAQDIVSEIAEDELPIFENLFEEYESNPEPPDLAAVAGDDPLSSGLGETLIAVSPAAIAMVSMAFSHILEAAVSELGASFSREWVERLFKRKNRKEISTTSREEVAGDTADKDQAAAPEPVSPSLALTRDQLEEVHSLACEEAKRFGMSDIQAHGMADALLRGLVLS